MVLASAFLFSSSALAKPNPCKKLYDDGNLELDSNVEVWKNLKIAIGRFEPDETKVKGFDKSLDDIRANLRVILHEAQRKSEKRATCKKEIQNFTTNKAKFEGIIKKYRAYIAEVADKIEADKEASDKIKAEKAVALPAAPTDMPADPPHIAYLKTIGISNPVKDEIDAADYMHYKLEWTDYSNYNVATLVQIMREGDKTPTQKKIIIETLKRFKDVIMNK